MRKEQSVRLYGVSLKRTSPCRILPQNLQSSAVNSYNKNKDKRASYISVSL